MLGFGTLSFLRGTVPLTAPAQSFSHPSAKDLRQDARQQSREDSRTVQRR